ncbi:NUDIX domain-containing protein [Flavobacterium sp. HBTb2-11-1]|uniref:NUDIX hydrolase n=1 Tax=Flavobacterium sp. HBTb2-11-1 TaxID=2692212 RepID=UPI00136FB1F7|nr:NUDIX domain-containing protein [Flavobacterium sp. HBTb2-11-1]MXO06747.1 NUDIX hydrolase [Flavobacterium sp. HBTb2-11-1]
MKKEESEERVGFNLSQENKIEIDCVIFCFEDRSLKVLLVKNENDATNGNWRLPSASLEEGETILKTAQKILKKYISEEDFFLEQLRAFGYHSSASFQENISIGYYAMVNKEKKVDDDELPSNVIWIDVHHIADLEEKYMGVIDFSIKELRKNICCSAVGFNLLPEKFTLLQVIHLYEIILGIEINKTNFRRKILQRRLVRGLAEKEEGVSNRAAEFYSLNVPKHEIFWNAKFNFNF